MASEDDDAPWYCEMNGDESRNTCEAEAEPMPMDDAAEPEEQFEVESIRAQRTTEEGAVEYLIRWKGHTWEDDTWEPKENVLDPALVADFEACENAREEKLAKKGAQRGKPAAGADAKAAKRKARGLVKF